MEKFETAFIVFVSLLVAYSLAYLLSMLLPSKRAGFTIMGLVSFGLLGVAASFPFWLYNQPCPDMAYCTGVDIARHWQSWIVTPISIGFAILMWAQTRIDNEK